MALSAQAPGIQKIFPILVGWTIFFLALATLSRLLMDSRITQLIAAFFDTLTRFYQGAIPENVPLRHHFAN